jgi:hypothetical protein
MIHTKTEARTAGSSLCPVCRSAVVETVIRRVDLAVDQPFAISQVRRDCTECPWVDIVRRETPQGLS